MREPKSTNLINGYGGISGKLWNLTTPSKKKFFVLVRPVADGINLATLFPPDPLQERDNAQLRIVNCILYGNGKPIQGIFDTSIQLVRTCLVLNWNQDKKSSSWLTSHWSLAPKKVEKVGTQGGCRSSNCGSRLREKVVCINEMEGLSFSILNLALPSLDEQSAQCVE